MNEADGAVSLTGCLGNELTLFIKCLGHRLMLRTRDVNGGGCLPFLSFRKPELGRAVTGKVSDDSSGQRGMTLGVQRHESRSAGLTRRAAWGGVSALKNLFYPPTLYTYKIEISSKINKKKASTVPTLAVEG